MNDKCIQNLCEIYFILKTRKLTKDKLIKDLRIEAKFEDRVEMVELRYFMTIFKTSVAKVD